MFSFPSAPLMTSGKQSPISDGSSGCGMIAISSSSSSDISSSGGPRDEGYDADWESLATNNASTRPPEQLHLRNHQQHYRDQQHRLAMRSVNSIHDHQQPESQCHDAKRQKLSEDQFSAHHAHMDLEAAGQQVPQLCCERDVVLSTGIDVSHVDVVYSSQLPGDGYHALIQTTNDWHKARHEISSLSADTSPSQDEEAEKENDSNYNILQDEFYIKDLLQITSTFYNATETSCTSSETESSASSISDTESEYHETMSSAIRRVSSMLAFNSTTPLTMTTSVQRDDFMTFDVQPLRNQSLAQNYYDAVAASVKTPLPTAVVALPPCAVTMAGALDVCQQGRLVVNCLPPFQVVHANAVVARMNGCGCPDIVGQPLSKVLVLTQTTGKLQGSFGEERTVAVRQLVKTAPHGSVGHEGNTLSCTMKIVPIVSDMTPLSDQAEQKCITHLCIDLVANDTSAVALAVEHRFPTREDLSMAYVMG